MKFTDVLQKLLFSYTECPSYRVPKHRIVAENTENARFLSD